MCVCASLSVCVYWLVCHVLIKLRVACLFEYAFGLACCCFLSAVLVLWFTTLLDFLFARGGGSDWARRVPVGHKRFKHFASIL